VLGGARSGKSQYAERCALNAGLEVLYIATAEAGDAEMAARIARHRERRPSEWVLVEEPFALAHTLRTHAAPEQCLIVDCLTLWLSNLLTRGDEEAREGRFQHERAALIEVLPTLAGEIYLISNEVGSGIVPANPLARRFVDEAGWLHQHLARLCERVVWVVAGLAHVLKDSKDTG
jgi:Adenosyl cobinamide kinase/adenosyl cobinamide phosphate guanylyltransferase